MEQRPVNPLLYITSNDISKLVMHHLSVPYDLEGLFYNSVEPYCAHEPFALLNQVEVS